VRYTIYKTTNLVNGKIYIGKHQTNNPDDSYYGSGSAIKRAIKKYGKENFKKDILYNFDTVGEMDRKEKELIDESFINRKDTYNRGVGGEGGPHFKGKTHSQESIDKFISSKRKNGYVVSQETRKKISDANYRRHLNPVSEETRKKISEKAKERFRMKKMLIDNKELCD